MSIKHYKLVNKIFVVSFEMLKIILYLRTNEGAVEPYSINYISYYNW